jgi:hypothetical protein
MELATGRKQKTKVVSNVAVVAGDFFRRCLQMLKVVAGKRHKKPGRKVG